MRTFLSCLCIGCLFSDPVEADQAPVNQYTWNSVERILLAKFPNAKLGEVQSVNLSNIVVNADDSKRSVRKLVDTAQIFNAVNCTDEAKVWSRKISVTERTTVTVKYTEVISSTQTTTVEASGNLFKLIQSKVTFENEEKKTVTNEKEQVFFSEKKLDYEEEYTIPARHRLFVRIIEKTKVTALPFDGTAIVDAKVRTRGTPLDAEAELFGGGIAWGPAYSLSDIRVLPKPSDRTVDLNGEIEFVEAETIDIVYEVRTIAGIDPAVCFVEDPPDLKSIQ